MMVINTLSRILGRKGMIQNFLLLGSKNDMREDDEMTRGCASTNMERYFFIDERDKNVIYNRKRLRSLKV